MEEANEYLTAAEVAARLRVSRGTVLRWLVTGRLAGRQLGNRAGWRIEEHQLRRFMRGAEEEAGPLADANEFWTTLLGPGVAAAFDALFLALAAWKAATAAPPTEEGPP